MFFDEAKIWVKAGDGGNGCLSFRREKYVPLGGPNGGNGGAGGSVYLVVDRNLNTLIHFKKRSHFKAGKGGNGRGKKQTGARGKKCGVSVPPGTVVYDADSGELLADLTKPEQEVLVAAGGRGGRGNASFATSTNQAPRIAEKGEPGQERWLRLELKLIADVGIVGKPNAGKSTLLASVTAARPKIAAYPFTTLEPNLGVAMAFDQDIVLADIPGLIEGAHQGLGLGHAFLRHVERTRVLVHLLDGTSPDPVKDWEDINAELALFNAELGSKPQVVVLNKMDVPEVREMWPQVKEALRERGAPARAVSAATGEGVRELLGEVVRMLREVESEASVRLPAEEKEVVIRPDFAEDEKLFTIEQDRRMDDVWHVRGRRIERVAAMTNWGLPEAVLRFQRILEALGIRQALEEAGAGPGDTVLIGDAELVWED